MEYQEKIFDITTGKTTFRKYTLEEIENIEALAAEAAVKEAARQALLDKLGITEDEAKLLLS
jgi:hypothetical protein